MTVRVGLCREVRLVCGEEQAEEDLVLKKYVRKRGVFVKGGLRGLRV